MNLNVSADKKQAVMLIWLLATTILSAYGFITPQQVMTTAQILEALETASPEQIAGLLQIVLNSSFSLLQKGYSYVISQVSSYTCVQNGATGKLESYGIDAETLIQNVLDNAALDTMVKIKGSITISDTLNISRAVSLDWDSLTIDTDKDGIVIGGQASTSFLPIIVKGTKIVFPENYTKSVIKLHNTRDVTVDVKWIFVASGFGSNSSVGVHLLGDGTCTLFNTVYFRQIGAAGNGLLLESDGSGSSVNANDLYGGWIWAANTGINITNGGGYGCNSNSFHYIWLDGATKMNTGIHNEGNDSRFYDVNESDMGTNTCLNNTSGATARFFGGQIDADYTVNSGTLKMHNVRFFVVENVVLSPSFAVDAVDVVAVTIPHGLDVQPYVEDCQVTLIRYTAVSDYVIGFIRVDNYDATNVYVEVKITNASATGGAVAKLTLHVKVSRFT